MADAKQFYIEGKYINCKDAQAREDLLTKVGWGDTNKFRNLKCEKIVDGATIVPSGYTAQGFALDGTYYYMYTYSDTQGTLRKIRRSDNVQVAANNLPKYHGNNITLSPDGTKLLLTYNTDASGNNIQTVGVFTTSSLKYLGTFDTGNVTYACGLASVNGFDTLIYGISNSRSLGVKIRVNDNQFALTEFINLEYAQSGLKQGMHLGSFIYLPVSYYGITKNEIIVLDYSGNHVLSLYPDFTTEIEDVSRVSGEERLYMNDSAGNIYKSEPTDGFFHLPYVDYLDSNYVKTTPRIIANSQWSNAEMYTSTDGTKSIPKTIQCNPSFSRITNQMVVGSFQFDSAYYPIAYNPITGALQIRGIKNVGFTSGGVYHYQTRAYDITYTWNDSTKVYTLEHIRVTKTDVNSSTQAVTMTASGISESGIDAQAKAALDAVDVGGQLILLQAICGANYGVAPNIIP